VLTLDELYGKIEQAIEQTNNWGELSWSITNKDNGLIRAKWLKPNAYIYVYYSNVFSLADTTYPGFSAESERLYQPHTKLTIKVFGLDDVLELIDIGFDAYLERLTSD
jgi:hypothetical protein